MSSPDRPSRSLASSIDTLRRQFGLARASSLAVVADRWPEAVGDAVAASTTVVEIRDGVLSVEAHDPAAAEVVRWSEARILEAVGAWCPDERMTRISVRVRRRHAPG